MEVALIYLHHSKVSQYIRDTPCIVLCTHPSQTFHPKCVRLLNVILVISQHSQEIEAICDVYRIAMFPAKGHTFFVEVTGSFHVTAILEQHCKVVQYLGDPINIFEFPEQCQTFLIRFLRRNQVALKHTKRCQPVERPCSKRAIHLRACCFLPCQPIYEPFSSLAQVATSIPE